MTTYLNVALAPPFSESETVMSTVYTPANVKVRLADAFPGSVGGTVTWTRSFHANVICGAVDGRRVANCTEIVAGVPTARGPAGPFTDEICGRGSIMPKIVPV